MGTIYTDLRAIRGVTISTVDADGRVHFTQGSGLSSFLHVKSYSVLKDLMDEDRSHTLYVNEDGEIVEIRAGAELGEE